MRFFEIMDTEQAKMLSPLSLAFVGDAVYTLFARTTVIKNSDAKSGVLHRWGGQKPAFGDGSAT